MFGKNLSWRMINEFWNKGKVNSSTKYRAKLGEMITWSNFSWSKLCFFTSLKVLINILSLDQIFWEFLVDRNFKITQNTIIRTFDQVPKKNLRILAVDWMYCWLRNSTNSINLNEFKKFRSTAKIRRFFFGSWLKLFKSLKYHY